jgi:type II secretory pathway pseudopilin PulG
MTQSPVTRRSGLTLVEILIAMVMTLIVLFAMMEAFKYASGEMQRSRAVIEMSSQLRAAQELLRSDLEHVTLDPKPWTQTALPKGYFEYVESRYNDNTFPQNAANPTDNYLGDVDDVLAFTVNRPEQPFRGRLNIQNLSQPDIVESSMAEIIWWTKWSTTDDNTGDGQVDDRDGNGLINFDESVSLHRRVLLIRPDLNNSNGHLGIAYDQAAAQEFLTENDLSVRVMLADDGNTYWAANRLEDLGLRSSRVGRNRPNSTAQNFPHVLDRNWLNETRMGECFNAIWTYSGDDVVLTNIAGFDVKVYSPMAAIESNAAAKLVIQPGDVNYPNATVNNRGAFVDLNYASENYNAADQRWFATRANPKSGLSTNINTTYDTWTPVYENDGIDQDNATDGLAPADGVDQGTNGIDDANVPNSTPAVDETAERETMPPYGHPIRGLKVSFRLVEKNTKQVRQASVIHSFVPE